MSVSRKKKPVHQCMAFISPVVARHPKISAHVREVFLNYLVPVHKQPVLTL
jgi:hypothetical protein